MSATGELVRSIFVGPAIWVWIVILLVVGLIAFFTVSPAPPDKGAGEPPP